MATTTSVKYDMQIVKFRIKQQVNNVENRKLLRKTARQFVNLLTPAQLLTPHLFYGGTVTYRDNQAGKYTIESACDGDDDKKRRVLVKCMLPGKTAAFFTCVIEVTLPEHDT